MPCAPFISALHAETGSIKFAFSCKKFFNATAHDRVSPVSPPSVTRDTSTPLHTHATSLAPYIWVAARLSFKSISIHQFPGTRLLQAMSMTLKLRMPIRGEVGASCSPTVRRLALPLISPSTQMPRVYRILFLIWAPASKSHMKTGIKFPINQLVRNGALIAASHDTNDVLVRKRA
jgi:hypothetical protein